MSNPHAVIERCTRDGVTSWQQVAKQLGRSVDSVRAQFDPRYLRAHVWAPTREPDPDLAPPIDENDTRSLAPKGPGLKVQILQYLQHGPECVEIIAIRLARPVNSIRARLDRLLEIGAVSHDGRYPRTWRVTPSGLRMSVTGCEVEGSADAKVSA